MLIHVSRPIVHFPSIHRFSVGLLTPGYLTVLMYFRYFQSRPHTLSRLREICIIKMLRNCKYGEKSASGSWFSMKKNQAYTIQQVKKYWEFINSLSSLSYDRSKASSKASSQHSAIQSFLLQMRVWELSIYNQTRIV